MLIEALKHKILNLPYLFSDKYRTVDFYDYHPQQLSELYDPGRERVWYFFVKKDKSKVCDSVITGVHRHARGGCWRGCDYVHLRIETNGYHGHKNFFCFVEEDLDEQMVWGEETDWVMQEYSIHSDSQLDGWSLCKMYKMMAGDTKFEFDDFGAANPDLHLLELRFYHIFGEQPGFKSYNYKKNYEGGTLFCHLRN